MNNGLAWALGVIISRLIGIALGIALTLSACVGVYALYALVVHPSAIERENTIELNRLYRLELIKQGKFEEFRAHGDLG